MLTGPASAAKTFGVSVYMLCSYYASPTEAMGMISTTSGAASEGRIWGDVKRLHRLAQFDKNRISRDGMGKIVDYLKCVTFDVTEGDGGAGQRDLRNGIQVIPISKDAKGEAALDTIMGRKNTFVYWVVDELPAMMDNVLRPRRNIESNPFCQIIGIGNANKKSDPHGKACEPLNGWSDPACLPDKSKVWKGKLYDVMFLSGEESPNDSILIDQSKIERKINYPFPYLANRISRNAIAKDAGYGDIERGKFTNDYNRFGLGYWYSSTMDNTIVTDEFVDFNNASQPPVSFNSSGFHTYAAMDPAWASGGDDCSVTFIKCGIDAFHNPQIEIAGESLSISPLVSEREEFRKAVAKEFVKLCKERGVQIRDAGMDTNGDGALLYKEVISEWKQSGLQALPSLEPATNKMYVNRVTEYWFATRDLISTGFVRGFDKESNYANDLKARLYSSVGKGLVCVEKKKDMKIRIGRSPDHGDSFSYCSWIVMKKWQYARNFKSLRDRKMKEHREKLSDYYPSENEKEADEFVMSHTYE